MTEAIQSLPDRCRQIFTLRSVYSMTQREIAEKLGISDRTVAAQLHDRRGEMQGLHAPSTRYPEDPAMNRPEPDSPEAQARSRAAAEWFVKHDRGLTAAEQDEFLQ